MNTAVRAPEGALHEAHVSIQEGIPRRCAGFGVSLRDHPADVRQTDETVEIGDGAGLSINRVDSDSGWTWAEDMVGPTERR